MDFANSVNQDQMDLIWVYTTIPFYSNQPTSAAPQSGATRGLVALRLERGSVLFYSRPIFKYE